MNGRLLVAATAAAIALSLAACGGSGGNYAACKAAMKAQFAQALVSGQQGTEPPACKGLTAADYQKIIGQILSGQ